MTELARQLATTHDVTLAAPRIDLDLPFATRPFGPPPLGRLLEQADVAIVHGHVGNEVLDADAGIPLVFDLYDPFLIENLAYAEALGPAVYRYDLHTLERQLRHGDLFLVASPVQRIFYLGALAMVGRVNPSAYRARRDLGHLLATVPFGVPARGEVAPPARDGSFRARLGIGDDPLIFFGGIYDWYDPLTALDALKAVVSELPRARMLVVRNPRQETTPQTLFGRTLARAGELGIADNIEVVDWIPYESRGAALADADVGLISHRVGIETDLSYRTRILDFMWAGLPVVASAGGGGSDLVVTAGAGGVVAPGDGGAMATALVELLRDEDRRTRLGRLGREHVLANQTWAQVAMPLMAWLEEPTIDPSKPGPPPARPGVLARLLSSRR